MRLLLSTVSLCVLCCSQSVAPDGAGPKISGGQVDGCYLDRFGWVRDGLSSALLNQRAFLCRCFEDSDVGGATVTAQVRLSSAGGVHAAVLSTSLQNPHDECVASNAGVAAANWVALWPDIYSEGGLRSGEELSKEWGKTEHSIIIDWEGIECGPQAGDTEPGPPHLSKDWVAKYQVARDLGKESAPPPSECRHPANVVFQFPVKVSAPAHDTLTRAEPSPHAHLHLRSARAVDQRRQAPDMKLWSCKDSQPR